MSRFLYITYYWPPSSGAGVQRGVKLVKYLWRQGLRPTVITVHPDHASYPGLDDSLDGDIPAMLTVVRTRSFEPLRVLARLFGSGAVPKAGFAGHGNKGFLPRLMRWVRGNLLLPDARRGWVGHAVKAAAHVIEKEDVGTVLISSPPHSAQLIGLTLKRRFPRLRWVADLRDPWTDIYYTSELGQGPRAARINAGYEGAVVSKADALVVVGPSMRSALAERYGSAVSDRIVVIPNGYDPEDIDRVRDVQPAMGCFRVTYVGSMAASYRPEVFFRAMALVKERIDRPLEIRFVGLIGDDVRGLAFSAGVSDLCQWIPPVSHDEALREMAASHLLLLVIPAGVGDERILTGKLFEYVGVGQPILGVGPVAGDAAEVLDRCGAGRMFGREDALSLANWVLSVSEGRSGLRPDPQARRVYERGHQAAALAQVLNGA